VEHVEEWLHQMAVECFPLSNITGVTQYFYVFSVIWCFVVTTKAALYVELVPVLCSLEVVLAITGNKYTLQKID